MPDVHQASTSDNRTVQVLWIHGVGQKTTARLMIRSLEADPGFSIHLRSWIGTNTEGLPPATTTISPSELADFDVVIREGGWLPGEHSSFEEGVLPWLTTGGQYVLLDVGRGPLIQPEEVTKPLRESYEWMRNVLGAAPRFMWAQDPVDPNELRRHLGEMAQRVGETMPLESPYHARQYLQWQLNRHSVSEGAVFYIVNRADPLGHDPITVEARTMASLDGAWGTALQRVDRLTMRYPVEIELGTPAQAVADVPFGLTYADKVPIPPYDHTWAAVSAIGDGHFALIGANFSADDLVKSSPDNAIWLAELVRVMVERTRENARWGTPSAQRSEAIDCGQSFLRDDEGERLERKSVPQDQGTGIDVFNVARSIAALANKTGGEVVVGQRDDLSFVELGELLASLGTSNQDKFLVNLIGKLDAVMEPRYTTLGISATWVQTDVTAGAPLVVRFEVPRASQATYVKLKKPPGYEFFVRNGNRTDRLHGPSLTDYTKSRFS